MISVKKSSRYPLYIKASEQHLFHCLTRLFNAVMDVEGSGLGKVDTITMQVQLLDNMAKAKALQEN